MKFHIFLLLGCILVLSCNRRPVVAPKPCCAKEDAAAVSLLTTRLSGDASVYQLPGLWTDQHNHSLSLWDLKGKVQVVAMVFTHCRYACPRLVADMKAIQRALPTAEKNEVGFVLVSFDVQRDDPVQMSRFAGQQQLDDHWVLLHGNAGQVRELSMALNVRYQRLANGDFSHSNAIYILDRRGGIRQILDGVEAQTVSAALTIKGLVQHNDQLTDR
ncbi:SCO family protein [Asinibacterium sp. OR53]|uniref:SCO family protein n=1 Tax=Asinibacterium sp. OR53 TaxID=925409 RepID=UPI0006879BB0|nr:SCO family protein [Asinibacterium sp. OR53]